MLDAYGQALAFLFQPMSLLLIVGAVLFGLIIGIIPGIGGMVGIAVMLPFIFRMPPEIALIFVICFHTVTYTGGCITAILLGIPGTNPNAATTLDGYPMTQRGEGLRAIGAAITSSVFGGFVPALLAAGMIPLIVPLVLAFKSAEMAILVLVGISLIAVLTGRSPTRGIISGALGMLLSLIGVQGVTGVYRFTFGSLFLYDGVGILAVALGLFGLAESCELVLKGQTSIASTKTVARLSDAFQGVKDVWSHKWLWFRSTMVGYLFGIIPGVGGEAATFVTYAQARQTSKHPETFGTGNVEGVIAPESANNAKDSGALLTTMAFGIPGSAVMALVISAFLLVGVTPGPRMLVDHLSLGLILLLGIALANVVGGIIAFFAAPYMVKVASIHIDFLFPLILGLISVGGLVDRPTILNIVVIIVFGILGLFMKRYDFPRAAFLLGFVLGELFESYLLLSLQLSGPLFFMTPINFILIAILVVLFSYRYLKRVVSLIWKRGVKAA